uniref:Peptidase S1 and S6, chymotrypsin/Hap n=1 Tax=Cyanothece sp. (strain PCC 7425 / ATCC 29141) TaxID=395961 RepID=B8HMX0_CYAP4
MADNYRQAFKAAIARIYHANGAIVGAGFLVSDRYLLTCAHVVTAALGIPTETVELPTASLELDFPLIAPGQKVKAKVVFWQPLNATQIGEDIAGLLLEVHPPMDSQPVRMVAGEELWNHPFQIFGFPSKRDEGIWASGVIRDRLANGWVQIEDIKAQGQAIQPGFSGSPIWDEVVEGVVGMAVAADKKRDETKTAFMIPTAILQQVWPELGQSVQQSTSLQQDRNSQGMKDFFIRPVGK